MRPFKIQISTQTDNQNQRKTMLQPKKAAFFENGLKISKPQLQHFMLNDILEQNIDYVERAAQIKGQPVWWDSFCK